MMSSTILRIACLRISHSSGRFFSSRAMSAAKVIPAYQEFMDNASLIRQKSYIGGKWVDANGGDTFEVKNPATGELITEVANCGAEETQQAIFAAQKAFITWRETTAKERSGILRRWFDLITKNQKELAMILTAENGKPLPESEAEVASGASFFEWYSEEARHITGEVISSPSKDRQMFAIRQPVGVAAMITPWNFPSSMLARKVSAALAAGCTCVMKPAAETPLSALALVQLGEDAGVPPGVVNIITGTKAADIGKALCESPNVAKISFTGSTPIGKLLIQQSASTVKRVSLELGGHAPFIVFNSADVDKAVEAAIFSKFRGNGQTCICANRILVQEKVYDAFADKMAEAINKKLRVGNGFEKTTTQGPLISIKAMEKVKNHVADAVANGGKVLTGGKEHPAGAQFFEPTLIRDVPTDALIFHEETFGPVAPLVKFRDEDEALAIANSARVGLAGYFFSQDISQIWRVAQRLEVGMVGANTSMISTVEGPFGGVKESGYGREGSRHGMDDYTSIKFICLGGL